MSDAADAVPAGGGVSTSRILAIPALLVCGATGGVLAWHMWRRRRQLAVGDAAGAPAPQCLVRPEHLWTRVQDGGDLQHRVVCGIGFPVNLRSATSTGDEPVADLRIFEAERTIACGEACAHIHRATVAQSDEQASADSIQQTLRPLLDAFGNDSAVHLMHATALRSIVHINGEPPVQLVATIHLDGDMLALCVHNADAAAQYVEKSHCIAYLILEPAEPTKRAAGEQQEVAASRDEPGAAALPTDDDADDSCDSSPHDCVEQNCIEF